MRVGVGRGCLSRVCVCVCVCVWISSAFLFTFRLSFSLLFYSGDLCPHSRVVCFDDISIYRIGGGLSP